MILATGPTPMDAQELQSRISRITTQWTLLHQAHRDEQTEAQRARSELLTRYYPAVYRYLLALLRDADAADDVCQQFAVRFLQGGFRSADPQRGRFRDYLKTAVVRLSLDWRRRRNPAGPLPEEGPPAAAPTEEVSFDAIWRDELLTRAWRGLQSFEEQSGSPYFSILRFRTEHPDASAADMAQRLSQQLALDKPLSDANTRKLLQRAREKFAELLLDEVALAIESRDPDQLEEEIVALELLACCRSALDKRRRP